MTLNKPSGNMYPWAYTINFLAGECQYHCQYCYVPNKIAPWLSRMGNDKYYGEPRLVEEEFKVPLIVPNGYVVFVQSCGDLFGFWVPDLWIIKILERIREFPQTTFLLQTKNPARLFDFDIPRNCVLGTTIESNRDYGDTKAPSPKERFLAFKKMPIERQLMIAIEPIKDFDLPVFLAWIGVIQPKFVSIGADSGENNLVEPSPLKLKQLLWQMEIITEVRKKKNLNRLLLEEAEV